MTTKFISQVKRLGLLFLLTFPSVPGQESGCPPGGGPGWWSRAATDLIASSDFRCTSEELRDLRILSPDHRIAVRVVKDAWWVEVGNRKLSLKGTESKVGYPAELAWSPDSRAFYITEGVGNIDGFRLRLYRVEDEGIRILPDVNRMVQQDFNRQHMCVSYPGSKTLEDNPNVAGVEWLGGSDQLLVVAEVPPHGTCTQMGYFGGYVVSVSSAAIMERFSPRELLRKWHDVVGRRLREEFLDLTAKQRDDLP